MTRRLRIHPAWIALAALAVCVMAASGLRATSGVSIGAIASSAIHSLGQLHITIGILLAVGVSLLHLLYVRDGPSLHVRAAVFGLNWISTVPPTTAMAMAIRGEPFVARLPAPATAARAVS